MIGKPDQFDGDPTKHADWSFKLRSYLGAVDQRYQEELMKTESSSTPRLNANLGSEESALSTQMYHILVMTTAGAALDKCHNAGVYEGFEAWRQFVMEWEPKLRTRYVGLLMNVLGYRFRDVNPTKLAAFERTIHDYENQSTKTVDDDIKIGVTMLGMEDMRVKEHLIRNSVRITSWNQMREEILEITRTHNSTSTVNQCQCSSERIRRAKARAKRAKAKAKARTSRDKDKAKDVRNESSKKVKSDDRRKCFYCNKTGHVKAECNKRLRDLAEAEEKPVAASPHPHDATAIVPLQCLLPGERHTSTFVIAMPCVNSETSCEFSGEQAVRSSGAGSFAPAETHRVRPIAAIPSNETYLMMDTCAGASIFPRGFDQNATDDSTVAPVRLSTATDDPVNGDAGKKSCFGLRDGRNLQVRYNEADVSFPIVSIGEASHQGNWFVFGPGCQAMLPGSSGEFLRTCVKDPNAARVGETLRSVLVAMFGNGTHGWSTVVPKSQSSKASCGSSTDLCA